MPKHKPIRFREPNMPEEAKERLKQFINNHPLAASAGKALFGLIALGGVLTFTAVVPGVAGAIGKSIERRKKEKRERYNRIWRNFYRLKQEQSLVYCGEEDGAEIYELTKNGEKIFKRFVLETVGVKTPDKWDGCWRVVIFDIPENFGRARRALQSKLKKMDFYPMQKSVWVHPFSCEDEIGFLKDFFQVNQYVHILRANDMPHGGVLYYFRNIIKRTI